jgi:APA family basic amino acid/polyamine antiporter
MSAHEHKISFIAAIFININIMLGAGLFMNTTFVAQQAGGLGALAYITVGILLLPLVISVANLVKIHPSGGLYIYGAKEIHPFAGFISAWSYFIGKLASCAIVIHTALRLVQQVIPLLQGINIIALDLIVLFLFVSLNMLNLRAGSTIQSAFLGFKLIPIFFAIFAGFYFFNGAHFSPQFLHVDGMIGILPIVLYAIIGFEAACSISGKIENAQQNASKVILISYGIVVALVSLYQSMFYGALGVLFNNLTSYLNAFPALIGMFHMPASANIALIACMHLAIAASALGGGYGVLFSNGWNLYTLAQHGHIFMPTLFTQVNRHFIPWLCILTEGLICALYLLVTYGNQIPLQQISALGSVIAYTISVCALLIAKKNNPALSIGWVIPLLGLANCCILITSCINGLINNGLIALIAFSIMLLIGAVMFLKTMKQTAL